MTTRIPAHSFETDSDGRCQQAKTIGLTAVHQLRQLQRDLGIDRRTLDTLSNNLGVVNDWQFKPSIGHFWSTVAKPRHDLYVSEGELILHDAGNRMGNLLSDTGDAPADASGRRLAVESFATHCVLPESVVRTGDRWYRRLRLRAIARAANEWPQRDGGTFRGRYRAAELDLLDSSPWCYQDRLLCAFEAAHRELGVRRSNLLADLRLLA